jgi:hypothetical protein
MRCACDRYEAGIPYEIQLTAHERDAVGSRHMTNISVARDGRAYVWANGEFYKFKIEPGPQAQEDQCLS